MTDDLFRLALGSYGQPWRFQDETSIEAQAVRQLLDLFRWTVKGQRRAIGPKGLIYCDLIENPTFNALATAYEKHEFVTLFSGAINHIYVVYFGMLSDAESLPSIGDASRESVSQEALDLIRAGQGIFAPSHLPRDAQRLQAARDLSLLTCLFILLHEVGHIVRGHPTFLQRKHGIAAYEEIPVSSINDEQARIQLAFEWEADEYAAITSYQAARAILQHGANLPALKPLDADLIWSISASMTFVLIGHLSGGMTANSPTHPPALYRYVWSMMSVESAPECKQFSPQTSALQRGFAEVAGWFRRNSLELRSGGHTVAEDEAALQVQSLHEQYQRVKQVLANESDLLADIESQRRLGAEAWRASNGIE